MRDVNVVVASKERTCAFEQRTQVWLFDAPLTAELLHDEHRVGADANASSSKRLRRFEARVDLSIPSLADALEPIAVRTLVDNTVAIVRGLFGEDVVVEAVTEHPAGAGLPALAGGVRP